MTSDAKTASVSPQMPHDARTGSRLSEHPAATVVRLRAMRLALWMRRLWAHEPESVHPAAIQHEEVDRLLADRTATAAQQTAFYEQDGAAAALTREIAEASHLLDEDERWRRLVDVFALTPAERQLLSLAITFALEPTIGRAFAYLHDQPEMTYPTPWLAAALYGPGAEPAALTRDGGLFKWRLVTHAPDALAVQGIWLGWIADPAIVAWLHRGKDADLPAGVVLTEAGAFSSPLALYPAELQAALRFLDASGDVPFEIELIGADGSGRRVLAGQIADGLKRALLSVSEDTLFEGASDADAAHAVFSVVRAVCLHDAVLYWRESRDGSGAASATAPRRAVRAAATRVIVGRGAPVIDGRPPDTVFRSFELPELSRERREELWRAGARGPVPWQVRDWLLTPGEIDRLARVERAGDDAIQQACRRPSDSLSLLVKLPLPFGEHDLVLPPAIQKAADDFENQVRFRWDVYESWGFGRLCPNGRGVIGLFAGPSGTGKTMTAQVLARKLGLELYRLDPAQVINKYIGETEKRLKTIFDECDRAHFLLLIDECEGMFGQRFSSKDAHDRYANLEIDYLLQRLERFQGVAILSTNRKADLDAAFLRRIRFIIDFLPPGPLERAKLWRAALPPKSPSGAVILDDDVDFHALAERVTLTGAEITLSALNAAFLARAAHSTIGMPHILEAVRRELAKKGQTLRGFE